MDLIALFVSLIHPNFITVVGEIPCVVYLEEKKKILLNSRAYRRVRLFLSHRTEAIGVLSTSTFAFQKDGSQNLVKTFPSFETGRDLFSHYKDLQTFEKDRGKNSRAKGREREN